MLELRGIRSARAPRPAASRTSSCTSAPTSRWTSGSMPRTTSLRLTAARLLRLLPPERQQLAREERPRSAAWQIRCTSWRRPVVGHHVEQQHLAEPADGGQQVVEVVRDAARDPAQGLGRAARGGAAPRSGAARRACAVRSVVSVASTRRARRPSSSSSWLTSSMSTRVPSRRWWCASGHLAPQRRAVGRGRERRRRRRARAGP